MEVIYGSIVMPATGASEAERGRITIYQELIPELDGSRVKPEDICCRIFGPPETLEKCRQELGWQPDDDFFEALFFKGDAAAALEKLKTIFPGLEALNSDDDEIFDSRICSSSG